MFPSVRMQDTFHYGEWVARENRGRKHLRRQKRYGTAAATKEE
jgi:hypothetical protein